MKKIVEISNLSKSFGGIIAIDDISLEFSPGISGLIGPNGAGKTSLFNIISGMYRADLGKISLGGKDITNLRAYQIFNEGIARTFQNIRLFKRMTILENVMIGFNSKINYNLLDSLFNSKKFESIEKNSRDYAEELLDTINLYERRFDYPTSLPYGHQRKLEIVRSLASKPKVLLLDEPAAGMNDFETEELMSYISDLDTGELIIILIEHNMNLVTGVCQKIAVLNHGKLIAYDEPSKIIVDDNVRLAYLGED